MSEKLPESPEAITYQLMKDVFQSENKSIAKVDSKTSSEIRATKQDILDTYSECLAIVKKVNFQ